MRTAQRTEKYSIDLICLHPCRIDRSSDPIADRRIVETGHERDKSMSLGIKTSKSKKHKSKYSDTTVSSRGHREVKPTPRGA